jgi:hypothetical protein
MSAFWFRTVSLCGNAAVSAVSGITTAKLAQECAGVNFLPASRKVFSDVRDSKTVKELPRKRQRTRPATAPPTAALQQEPTIEG